MTDIRALGIDVGSATVKIVGVDIEGRLAWHILEPAEPGAEAQIERFLAMPRQARLDAPKTLHHVMVRGLERRVIFRDDVDRTDFLARLATLAEQGAWTV